MQSMNRAMLVGALLTLGAAGAGAQETKEWKWTGQLGAGRTVYLRNINGEVRFEQGSGNTVEVRAEKRWRRGDPEDVRIEARMAGNGGGDIIICALWGERATCDESGYHGNNDRDRHWNDRNDVSVRFVVRIPANAKVEASTVNGGLVVDGTTADIAATTVNGDVDARSNGGRVEASTVNGSITVRTTLRTTAGTTAGTAAGLEYETVNGSITIELPASTNANVNLSTVNGRISSDFPLTLDGTINPRRIRAQLGAGGPTLRAKTVNGSIRLRKI